MQVSICKNGMQESNENSAKKVNKKVSNSKMSKSPKVAANPSSTPETYRESPQNVRLDTSESDEESVSEILLACLCLRPDLLESFPQDQDDISTEEFPEDESCESENDEQEEDVSDEEEESSNPDNSDDDSDVTDEEHPSGPSKKFLLDVDDDVLDQHPQFSKQARIDAILEAAAAGKDKKGNSVLHSAAVALDEAAQTITRMRSDASPRDKNLLSRSLIAACTDNDVSAVRRLLVEGNSLNEATDDGDSLLSLACSAGYYELAQVLLAMSAQVEDRGQKNDCTPLMEAASAGHIEIIELLIRHGADVNAQSSTGNTPLMYACAGGHVEAVKTLLSHGANVEDHNENGHTPLMEAASAGHVAVAKILLDHGAGINTHSNEFKESALTLACYKGHLDMVRFLLEAGADQEHKTDEMHTALMEASMDGHVEVARLLLDSGAQVNMPTDSFESPLTLAACGGHVDLAMLLIERGANIEEVNDEGYTPLMEAAREGHDEMVSLLLTQGANINAQTEETQETALTLACCGGFLEVADYLIKHGADIELGASTPLMEAAQEGHLDLVKFLLENKADVHAQTQTGDTALTYACENGHTDVAEMLLLFGAALEHLSEGGRTPLMKACRAGHICTVKFLIQKGADVNRQTTNNDHTPLSLACAGGHQQVVELLLAHGADPFHKLKDNSTMLIEAAKGGHTLVVQLLLDYPTSIPPQQNQPIYIPAPMPHQATPQFNMAQMKHQQQQQLKMLQQQQQQQHLMAQQAQQQFLSVPPPGLHDVTEVIRLAEPPGMFQPQPEMMQNQNFIIDPNTMTQPQSESSILTQMKLLQSAGFKDGLAYGLTKAQTAVNQMVNQQTTNNMNMAPCANQHQPMITNNLCLTSSSNKQKNLSRKKCSSGSFTETPTGTFEARSAGVGEEEENVQLLMKSSLEKLDNTLKKNIQFINDSGPPPTLLPSGTYVDITTPAQGEGNISVSNQTQTNQIQSSNKTTTHITAKSEVSQATAISDRPKAKPKNSRKLQQQQAQKNQAQSETIVQPPATLTDQKPLAAKSESENQTSDVLKIETHQEVPQTVPEASSTAILSPDEKDKATDGNRACSLVDLENLQKMRFNNLSTRSAHWNPKVFRKIAQLIDPPKSPTETPPESSNTSRPSSPDAKNLASDMAELTHIFDHIPALQSLSGDPNILQGKFKRREPSKEDLEKTLATLSEMNASDFVCDGTYPSLEESLESFNPDDVTVNPGDDAHGPIYNYEWVDEVMQALNVSPDISNAFHEIAANINNQDLEQYANIFGLNQICKTKWASPHWPPTQHQGTSGSSSPTNENDEIIHDGSELIDGKDDEQNLLMTIDQSCYQAGGHHFTAEQLQFISQLQQQSLLQIDPHATQNILTAGANFQIPQQTVITSAPGQTHKSQADAQQQTKFVFNVDNDKSSQSLQLLFQLPSDGQQQQQMKAPDGVQKNLQNVAQTQTMTASGPAQPGQHPSFINHQQAVLNFQLQQQQQQQQQQPGVQMNQQIVSANVQQQKVQQVPQFISKNYQQVQVATQTQMIGTQTQASAENVQHPTTSNKSTNVSVTIGKKSTSGDQKRKEKSRYALRSAPSGQNQYQYDQQLQQYASIPGSTSTGTTTDRAIEIDSETESNHDTALTLACAGGHEELVDLLLTRKANIEHRDKKGFTPLILAATAGHEKVVELLINNNADLEAQSERTKDTPLSLACSGGRYEVVELLLKYGANKEHRNVSDYTPLSLAASGGYVNIIKLLLTHGAEINSRTGSKLGISPLMLAAMNGHTAAVRLLLDMGSDINAQIETNRNTALTLACFQGRNEVVSLLLDRKANVEHRAKTGLTPLMEAASGGYIEVGRVLLDKGADVNAAPVPSSRDTALTIAADKGHLKFVELLLSRGAAVEVKNKKGNSPLWLAANGGHLTVVEALYHAKADIDSQDNRKVSCLMAAFRKGHIKVVKWMVNHVTQFPSDQEMTRYISVVDKEVVEKCQECVKIIRAAKETQAAKANINASILLKELDMEKSREDARKAAAAKRRERKKRRKQEKREAQRKLNGEDEKTGGKNSNQKGKASKNDEPDSDESEEESNDEEEVEEIESPPALSLDKEEGDSGIDQGSCSSSDAKGATTSKNQVEQENASQSAKNQKNQKKRKNQVEVAKPANGKASTRSSSSPVPAAKPVESIKTREDIKRIRDMKNQRSADLTTRSMKPVEKENVAPKEPPAKAPTSAREAKSYENSRSQHRKSLVFGNSRSSAGADENDIDRLMLSAVQASVKPKVTTSPTKASTQSASASASKPPREEEWKEVGRKPASASTTTAAPAAPSANEIGCKKIQVPLNAISRVIGRGGSNINAIRAATGAHIEVEKQGKTQGDRSITIKGVAEATKQAHNLISTLIKDPDADILSMLPRNNFQPVKSSSSTNVVPTPTVPPTSAAINNGTSVWEKSLNTFPTVQNPVKPASSFAGASKPAAAGIAKSITPTQLNSKSQRSSVAKNLFAPATNIMRPTPLSGKSSSMQDNSKKGMVATNGPPSKPATSMPSSMQALRNSIANAPTVNTSQASAASTTGTFASKLSGSNDGSATNAGKSSTSSPTKQMPIGSNSSTSTIPAPFTNSVSTSSSLGGLVQTVADSFANAPPTTITRSITPIGPPTRNINASPHSSHIVNTLDLSTPYNSNSASNDMTHIQSKLGDLHVNDQRSEYSLFYNYIKWSSQDKPMDFNPLKISASYIESEPLQVDASKAPGYRGTSINSPVSSKTSSNSATPPQMALATQAPTSGSSVSQMQNANNAFGDANVIKPIGQGPIQPPGPVQRPSGAGNNRMDMSYNRGQGFFDYNDQSSYGSMNNFMNQQQNVNASMSRLNPKASSFSTTSGSSAGVPNQNKMNDHMYGGSFMAQNNSNSNNNNNNNNNFMKSPGSSNSSQLNYQRPNQPVGSNQSRWFQGGYGSFGGQENEYTGPSPSMSPNNNSHQSGNGPIDDSRKAPAPIGNERTSYKYYGGSGYGNQNLLDMDASAMMNAPSMAPGRNSYMDSKSQWGGHMPQSSNMPRGPYDQPPEFPMQDIFPYQSESNQQQMNFMRGVNGQNSFHPGASFMGGNDLTNLSSDSQQSSYEFEKQPWAAKWTH